jgi:hypothetical protein
MGELRPRDVPEFPISTLEPGDYVLRAVVSLDGEQIAHLVRTIRKSD